MIHSDVVVKNRKRDRDNEIRRVWKGTSRETVIRSHWHDVVSTLLIYCRSMINRHVALDFYFLQSPSTSIPNDEISPIDFTWRKLQTTHFLFLFCVFSFSFCCFIVLFCFVFLSIFIHLGYRIACTKKMCNLNDSILFNNIS